jgi:hypothetical protein
MTICAGLLCSDGIVLGADSLESSGSVHRNVEKLVKLRLVSDALSAVVVCATDNGTFADALIEKISEALDRSDGTFASAREELENAVLKYCREIWGTFTPSQTKPSVEMLIGLKAVDDLRLLHVSAPSVRTIENWEFIGYGADLGTYKAKQYGLKNIPTDTAAPIIAYILDIVKNNIQYCGGPTNLAILHPSGHVEHKSQDYISKTTQGYKVLEWLLDTWVFPFLPLFVGNTGEDALSMISKVGMPKTEWVEKIPGMLQMLAVRKKSILAGEILAIPEDKKRKTAVHGFSFAARMIKSSAKELYEEDFINEKSNHTIQARYQKVLDFTDIIKSGMDSPDIDKETIRGALDRLCLVLTSFESLEQLKFDTPEDEPKPRKSPKRSASRKKARQS